MSGNIRHSTTSIRATWRSFIALKLQRIFASAAFQSGTFARPIQNHTLWSLNRQTTEEILLSGSPLPSFKPLQHPRKLVENAEQTCSSRGPGQVSLPGKSHNSERKQSFCFREQFQGMRGLGLEPDIITLSSRGSEGTVAGVKLDGHVRSM